jgi:hypothetical protein
MRKQRKKKLRKNNKLRVKKTKTNGSVKAFYTQHELLKIYLYLQTTFAAETHLAERQWLKEQLNMVK